MRHVLVRWMGAIALVAVAGCSTMRARPPDEARRASLAVLCSDPEIHGRPGWCRPEHTRVR
jgi:hypothetical protein